MSTNNGLQFISCSHYPQLTWAETYTLPPLQFGSILEFLWFFLCKERTTNLSTKFLVINKQFSKMCVEKLSFPSFPQKISRRNLENPPPIFRAVKTNAPIFHSFHTPYYYYDKRFQFFLYFCKLSGKIANNLPPVLWKSKSQIRPPPFKKPF